MNIKYSFVYFLLFSGLVAGTFSCARKSTNKQKTYFLGNSAFRGNVAIKNSELEALIPQKPNRRLLGLPFFPYVGLYRFGELFYNKEERQRDYLGVTQKYQKERQQNENNPKKLEKIDRKYAKKISKAQDRVEKGNFWMRVLGEKPVYYDLKDVAKNAEKMKLYLSNNGFFDGQVTFRPDTLTNRIRTIYQITEGKPTNINKIEYRVKNQQIDSLLISQNKNTYLVRDKRYDDDAFELERIRIENILRNSGYYGFSRKYVNYLINDTISDPKTDSLFKRVDVQVRVDIPAKDNTIRPLTIKSVNFEVLPPSGVPDSLFRKDTINFRGTEYIFSDKKFSKKVLSSKILMKPGDLYSQDKERATQQQLALTDQFRFINYSYKLDSTGTGLHSYFKAIPLDKYQISTDVGLNVIQLQGAPGPFANLSYKIRNVFNGLENFEANVRGGIELVPGFISDGDVYRSEEIAVNTSLIFPRLLFPGTYFQKKTQFNNPKTQVGVGYNYVNRPEYTRTNVKMLMTYSWQPKSTTLFNLSLVDLNILNTQNIRPDFLALLDTLQKQGNNLKNSFQKSFVSAISANFVYNTNPLTGPPRRAHYFRIGLESGGTSLNLVPKQISLIKNVFGDSLQFYKYLRVNVDFRRYWPMGKNSLLITRINSGAVYSYGDSDVPPYEKYFFAGGSNSVRAWLPRRLGPGSSKPRLTANNLSVESPGEFLLEGNLEYRGHLTHLFGDINYALFIDAGNVWMLKSYTENSQKFSPDKLLKEIAIGTGFGIRYDLSYFVLRFDFGVKVYDPSLQRFVLNELDFKHLFQRSQPNFLNVNLGVGYPF